MRHHAHNRHGLATVIRAFVLLALFALSIQLINVAPVLLFLTLVLVATWAMR